MHPHSNESVHGLNQAYPPPDKKPMLQNVVATATLGATLDLKLLSRSARNTEYRPRRFAAVVSRFEKPKATVLIFETGKIVCTGAKTEDDAMAAAKRCSKMVRDNLKINCKAKDFKVQNMVANCSIGFSIRLDALALEHSAFAQYEPDMFPGLIYRMQKPKLVLLIFVSGKIIFTGAKSEEDILTSWNLIYSVLVQFRKIS